MKKKTVQCSPVGCLLSATMLFAVAGTLPKANEANRATQQIMKRIRIPPPYTPVTPNYSPKVISAEHPWAPKFAMVAPPAPVAATTAMSATVTNVPAVDNAVKTPAPVATPEKEKASEVSRPAQKRTCAIKKEPHHTERKTPMSAPENHKYGIRAYVLLVVFAIGCSTIHSAAGNGNLAAVQRHLQEGADLNAKDKDDMTPLMWAAYNGHLEVTKYLVEKGADVNAKAQTGETSLMCAAGEGHPDVVEFLKQHGAKE